MAGYLLQTATAVPGAALTGARLRPSLRSRSPIAEFDQRLGSDREVAPMFSQPGPTAAPEAPAVIPSLSLTNPAAVAASLGSGVPVLSTEIAPASVPARAAGATTQSAVHATSILPPAAAPVAPMSLPSAAQQHYSRPGPVDQPAQIPQARDHGLRHPLGDSAVSTPVLPSSPPTGRPSPAPRGEGAAVSPMAHSSPAGSPTGDALMPASTYPRLPATPTRDPARAIPVAFTEAPSPSSVRSAQVRASAADPVAVPALATPQVIIDRLQIEVVPPAAPVAAAARAARRPEAGARPRGPVSQIGPLQQSTASRHHLALRYR